jgi:hypothetical protein
VTRVRFQEHALAPALRLARRADAAAVLADESAVVVRGGVAGGSASSAVVSVRQQIHARAPALGLSSRASALAVYTVRSRRAFVATSPAVFRVGGQVRAQVRSALCRVTLALAAAENATLSDCALRAAFAAMLRIALGIDTTGAAQRRTLAAAADAGLGRRAGMSARTAMIGVFPRIDAGTVALDQVGRALGDAASQRAKVVGRLADGVAVAAVFAVGLKQRAGISARGGRRRAHERTGAGIAGLAVSARVQTRAAVTVVGVQVHAQPVALGEWRRARRRAYSLCADLVGGASLCARSTVRLVPFEIDAASVALSGGRRTGRHARAGGADLSHWALVAAISAVLPVRSEIETLSLAIGGACVTSGRDRCGRRDIHGASRCPPSHRQAERCSKNVHVPSHRVLIARKAPNGARGAVTNDKPRSKI